MTDDDQKLAVGLLEKLKAETDELDQLMDQMITEMENTPPDKRGGEAWDNFTNRFLELQARAKNSNRRTLLLPNSTQRAPSNERPRCVSMAMARSGHSHRPSSPKSWQRAYKPPQSGLIPTPSVSNSGRDWSSGMVCSGMRIMPSSNYYREQANLLFRLSMSANNHDLAERLMKRAEEMAVRARDADDPGQVSSQVGNTVSTS